MPFVRAGIPAVELISLDYGLFNIFWTPFDTVEKCSAASLGIVGRVLLDALDDLESGRTPKPLFAFLESGAAGIGTGRIPWGWTVPPCFFQLEVAMESPCNIAPLMIFRSSEVTR